MPQWNEKWHTVLVHKKCYSVDPANSRFITLESVPLKVFTSCLRDSVFSFLNQNEFIEAEIQKGFTSHVTGVLEHTSMIADIIEKARKSQWSVLIALLDLKNAFGEISHNLIQEVLLYHCIPDKTQALSEMKFCYCFKMINYAPESCPHWPLSNFRLLSCKSLGFYCYRK